MCKKIIFAALLISSLFAETLKEPVANFKASAGVVDIVINNNMLYTATYSGYVDIFDIDTKKLIQKIEVAKIKDFMGEMVDSKVYSVDVLKGKILILSQAENGFRRVHIYQNNSLELLIPFSDNLSIAKAKFIDENTILLALLSNEIILYDIKNRKNNWLIQVSGAKFSNFVLNEKKTQVTVADESGELKIHNINDGTLVKKLSGQNLDNVFQVDCKNSIIATAGQDRRVVIYDTKLNSAYYVSSKFLVYSVALSPSGRLAAYASDENNNVTIFNTGTKKILSKFTGNKMTLTNIVFINENEFLVSSDDNTVNLYKIDGR